jgi:hypothetical protein
MRIYRQSTLPIFGAIAAATLVAGMPAMAQDTQVTHAQSSSVTRTPIKGHVSVNKRRVVHIRKHVTVHARPAAPARDGAMKTTTTTTVHRSSSSSGQ